jgi:uncharacterized protein YjbJ (UPF0337 family)
MIISGMVSAVSGVVAGRSQDGPCSQGAHLEERSAQGDAGAWSLAAGRERELVMGLGKKAKNKAKVIKGRAKKNAGKATGNKRLKTEGKADVVTGNLKNAGEKVKDAVKR